LSIVLLKQNNFVSLLLQTLHEIPERISSRKFLLFTKIANILHRLHQITHPFFAKITIGKGKFKTLGVQLQADEVKILFTIAADSLYVLNRYRAIYMLEPLTVVEV
jgi:hypothetical protein